MYTSQNEGSQQWPLTQSLRVRRALLTSAHMGVDTSFACTLGYEVKKRRDFT